MFPGKIQDFNRRKFGMTKVSFPRKRESGKTPDSGSSPE
jgi:hypothetical protein